MKKRIIPIICTGVAIAAVGTAFAAGVQISKLTSYGSLIDIKTAIDLAIDETGLYSDQVFVTKAELEKENGIAVYEIEIITPDGKAEYDINAADGTVASGKKQPDDIEKTTNNVQAAGLEAAKAAAFKHAGVNSGDVTVNKAKLDREDGLFVYEIKFSTADLEYDYEVDYDGKILEYSAKALKKPAQTKPSNGLTTTDSLISLDAAKNIAVEHSKVNVNNIMFKKAKLDKDDGVSVYEIEFYTASHEYEYEIDAATGNIIEYDIEDRD